MQKHEVKAEIIKAQICVEAHQLACDTRGAALWEREHAYWKGCLDKLESEEIEKCIRVNYDGISSGRPEEDEHLPKESWTLTDYHCLLGCGIRDVWCRSDGGDYGAQHLCAACGFSFLFLDVQSDADGVRIDAQRRQALRTPGYVGSIEAHDRDAREGD